MNGILQTGDQVVWDKTNLIANRELYQKRLKDYGLGPFEVVEINSSTVIVAKDGARLVYIDTGEIVEFLKHWFTKK